MCMVPEAALLLVLSWSLPRRYECVRLVHQRVAFSPADVMSLTRRVKMMMLAVTILR